MKESEEVHATLNANGGIRAREARITIEGQREYT